MNMHCRFLKYCLSLSFLLFYVYLYADICFVQQARISGKIVDLNGKPVVASVGFKGGGVEVATNEKGEFSIINHLKLDTLVVTGVHIEPTIWPLTNDDFQLISVSLKSYLVEEVVINTGYGTAPKERVAGSFGFVDNHTLNLQVGSNIMDRLEGVTSGLTFDRNDNVRVRGLSTINGPTDVLIVVDNF